MVSNFPYPRLRLRILQGIRLPINLVKKKTESVKTSKSVSGINSDGLTEKSKTSKLIQWKDFFLFFYCFTQAYKC